MLSAKRILKNLGAIFFGEISTRIIGMASAIILARYLGPEDYGKYALVVSIVHIFLILADFGLNDFMVKRVRMLSSRVFY